MQSTTNAQICHTNMPKKKHNAFAIHQIKNKEKHLVLEWCVFDSIGSFVMERS